jgi:hypothetical protein
VEDLKLEPVYKKPRRYKSDWQRHVTRMTSNTMQKVMLNFRPIGRRRIRRPLKRLLDEAETLMAHDDVDGDVA